MFQKAYYKKITFQFNFKAVTSRGELTQKDSWFIFVEKERRTGIGECSPIPGLSIDPIRLYLQKIDEVCRQLNTGIAVENIDLDDFPSIRFGLETALKDLEHEGNRLIFPGDFTNGRQAIPINGLVWMGDRQFMEKQIKEKIESGFRCIKLKMGALDFQSELELLEQLRKQFNESDLEIRLDVNGAFKINEAPEKLEKLSRFRIHSIEQPIKTGQWEAMHLICKNSPIPIALDEELIGIRDKELLLKMISPTYIIIKPTLIGGFRHGLEWIETAQKLGISWWVTSALESNIGLNAIAQWVSNLNPKLVQGLGTGMIFKNNIPSPLFIHKASLNYNPQVNWNTSEIL